MCGLSGFVSFNSQELTSEEREEILSLMSRAIARRGPDDEQFYDDGTLSFVFRRLSIIDLDGGQQPIWNEDKSIFVAVNGEIYNYQDLYEKLSLSHTFSTRSDSEVVLHLYEEYGEQAFEHLNGMYAVVLWDTKNQRLILARDRLGIKPLYYTETTNGLIFSSELKALLMHPDCPGKLNWSDLAQTGIQQKPSVSTYVQNVKFLEAGTFLTHSASTKLSVKPYWNINEHITPDKSTENAEYYSTQFSQLLDDAVAKQLMSDVPVGLFLSGGIDSSLIAAIAARNNQQIHCFTVAERTTVASGDIQQAIKLCKELNIPVHAGYIDAAEIACRFTLEDLERMVALIESPRFDPEWLFKYELHKFAKHQVPELKVILLGQGADEFAGGYSNMLGNRSHDWSDYINTRVAPNLKKSILRNHNIPERFTDSLEEDFIESLAEGKTNSYKTQMSLLVNQLQYFNLWHEDRTSAFNSLESRVPYLDHRLVEQLAAIPENLYSKLFWDKQIVREALRKNVPSYPMDKDKVPFFAIDEASSVDELMFLLANNLYADFRKKYLESDEPVFDWQEVDKLYEKITSLSGNIIFSAWQLIELMTVSIFFEHCKNPKSILPLIEKIDSTVIRTLTDEELENIEALTFSPATYQATDNWEMNSSIRVPHDSDLLTSMKSQDHTVILMEKNEITQRLTIPDSDSWAVDMLKHLAETGDTGDSISSLADKYTIDPQKIAQISSYLRSKGFIERV